MRTYRIETEVKSITTLRYFVEADSLEEAIKRIQDGKHKGEGMILNSKEIDLETKKIVLKELFWDKIN